MSPCLADVNAPVHASMPVCIAAVQGFHTKNALYPFRAKGAFARYHLCSPDSCEIRPRCNFYKSLIL